MTTFDAAPPNRRRSSRRLVLATVMVAAAIAATLVAAFMLGGSHPASAPTQEGGPPVPTGPQLLRHPIGTATEVTLAEAATAIGQALALPETPLVGDADIGHVWAFGGPTNGIVAVTYPAQRVIVEERPWPYPGPSSGYDKASKEIPGSAVIELGGTPALAIPQNPDKHRYGSILLDTRDLHIEVDGPYDESTLESVAQSIVRRSPARSTRSPLVLGPAIPDRKVSSAVAADAWLPFTVVLPSATPRVIEVSRPPAGLSPAARQMVAYFDTPSTGPYEVAEQPANHLSGVRSVHDLYESARGCHSPILCPVHEVVLVRGTHVLIWGNPVGDLRVFWLRGDRARSVLTWLKGPVDYRRGDLTHRTFTVAAVRAIAADMIARGG